MTDYEQFAAAQTRRHRRIEALSFAIATLVLLSLFVVIGAIALTNYDECRAHGFSRFYCLTAGRR